MPEQEKLTSLDLRHYSETLRRRLYDATVAHLWTPDHADDYVPAFTADASGLMVSFIHGRWIVTYTDLEEPVNAPPDQRLVMSRILADPDRPFGITLSEV